MLSPPSLFRSVCPKCRGVDVLEQAGDGGRVDMARQELEEWLEEAGRRVAGTLLRVLGRAAVIMIQRLVAADCRLIAVDEQDALDGDTWSRRGVQDRLSRSRRRGRRCRCLASARRCRPMLARTHGQAPAAACSPLRG